MSTAPVPEQSDSKYDDIETGHEYDGITEFDNRLPQWWLITLWGAVFFAFIYWLGNHTIGSSGSFGEWAEAKAEDDIAKIERSVSAEQLVEMSKDETVVGEGRAIFVQNCVTCHGEQAGGKTGPNLTDNAWKHGGKPKDVFKTVAMGVQATNMKPWYDLLGSNGVAKAVAYVLSIRNTNVPGGKPPEGEPYAAP